jgi:hypothetical protein
MSYDLFYRPDTYWPESLTIEQLLSRIKGEARRQLAREIIETEGFAALSSFLARSELSDAERKSWGAAHPSCMGGEYLPSIAGDEVEIARISLNSIMFDQISIRARHDNGQIEYAVVDEYETPHTLPFTHTKQPLTLGGLVALIDGTVYRDDPDVYPLGLIRSHWESMDEIGCDPEEAVAFASVGSSFYPAITSYYENEAQAWLARRYPEVYWEGTNDAA